MDAQNLPPAAVAEPEMSLASDSSSVLHEAPKSNRRRRARANSRNASSGENKTKRKRAGDQQEAEASSSRKPNRAKTVFNEDDGLLLLNPGGSDPLGMLKEFHPFLKERLDGDFTRTQIKQKVLGLKKSYFEKGEEKDLGGDSDEEGEYVFLRGALKILETLGMPRILDDGLTFIGTGDAKALNLLWRELLIEEVRVYIRKLELLKETTLKILDGMNKEEDS